MSIRTRLVTPVTPAGGGVDRDMGPGQKQAGVPQQGATSQATQGDHDVAEDANTARPPREAE